MTTPRPMHDLIDTMYLKAYRLLLPGRYREYMHRAGGNEDMCHETLLHGTFYEEYKAFGFADKDEAERRTYLTDSVRNRISRKINSPEGNRLINNKWLAYMRLHEFYRREMFRLDGLPTAEVEDFAVRMGSMVVKPESRCGGVGVELIAIDDSRMWATRLERIAESNGPCVVEGRIVQHEFMARFNPSSVNTIRYNTVCRHGRVQCFAAFLIAGRAGSFVNNGHQGGVLARVDTDTGQLVSDGCDKAGRRYDVHPDSGVPFKGQQLPQWQQLQAVTAEMARRLKGVTFVAWDMALTPEGWVLVEPNLGEFVAQQVCLGHGIRAEFERATGYRR